ncbi:MAG: NAD(P)/FAD-dependent oxidoreductase [Lachnospiraceae bacterium]|jgi:predicted Rossmann fold flavoprotein|nr:NAD(P)/FAD-dependent oxidoreductase [Lachnospiraceae bacterium]
MNAPFYDVIVIGGGAAGMLAGISAARLNKKVLLLEQNEKLGKKLYITGKGRCNITNTCPDGDYLDNYPRNPKFLYGSIAKFGHEDVIRFFEEIGLKTKVERGGRVFPLSDKSSDVIKALEKELNRLGVAICLNTKVTGINVKDGAFESVSTISDSTTAHNFRGNACLIATGGLSYSSTGSSGDGYIFAKESGHALIDCRPVLVAMNIKEKWCERLQGLTLKNVRLNVIIKKGEKSDRVFTGFGEMLFTHFGVSGPLILSASSIVPPPDKDHRVFLEIDLKRALTFDQLESRILRDFSDNINKQYKNALQGLLPVKLIPVMIELSGIPAQKKVNLITKEERKNLVNLIKGLRMEVDSYRGYNEAVVTRGGVDVKDINPKTMESKIIKGLYFAGEVIDVDGLTGGFNLQIAWSSGYVAGQSAG